MCIPSILASPFSTNTALMNTSTSVVVSYNITGRTSMTEDNLMVFWSGLKHTARSEEGGGGGGKGRGREGEGEGEGKGEGEGRVEGRGRGRGRGKTQCT